MAAPPPPLDSSSTPMKIKRPRHEDLTMRLALISIKFILISFIRYMFYKILVLLILLLQILIATYKSQLVLYVMKTMYILLHLSNRYYLIDTI